MGVIIAGADVARSGGGRRPPAHDERARWCASYDDARRRRARRLPRAPWPRGCCALVEARLELDEATACLPPRWRAMGPGRAAIVARAVHASVDGEHVGVGRRLLDEASTGRERVVGVVDEDVLSRITAKASGGSSSTAAGEGGSRRPGRSRRSGSPSSLTSCQQLAVVERALEDVHLVLVDAEEAHELPVELVGHPRRPTSSAHRRPEAPAPQLVRRPPAGQRPRRTRSRSAFRVTRREPRSMISVPGKSGRDGGRCSPRA